MRDRWRSGLALWEVLVAASGMLLIAFAGAGLLSFRSREEGYWPSCRRNASMLATAVLIYAQDYDDRLPPAHYTAGGQLTTLPSFLNLYVKNGSAWCCPELLRRGDEKRRFDGNPGDTTVSYGYNWLALAPQGRGVRTDQVQNPSETVLFAETSSYRVVPARLQMTYRGTVPEYAHLHRCTVAWLDGHTRYIPRLELEHVSTIEGRQTLGAGIGAYSYWDLE